MLINPHENIWVAPPLTVTQNGSVVEVLYSDFDASLNNGDDWIPAREVTAGSNRPGWLISGPSFEPRPEDVTDWTLVGPDTTMLIRLRDNPETVVAGVTLKMR